MPAQVAKVARFEEALIIRAQRGEKTALEALIRQHERAVYALVSRMLVKRPTEVDDVAQEVFVKVVRALSRFDSNGPATFSTWILLVATRTAIDALRRPLRTRDEEALGNVESEEDRPDEVASARELEGKLRTAIAELPSNQRAVLILRAYHDLDYPEIAEALGIETGTVKSRLSRARSALRRFLPRNGGRAEGELDE